MANAKNTPAEDEEYYNICAGIIPLISDVIDEKGGLTTLAMIGIDPRVREAVKELPPDKSRKTRDIVKRFPEYISMFPKGGVVATAKGYEEGLVNDDGTISQEVLDQLIQQPGPKRAKSAQAQNGGMMTSTRHSPGAQPMLTGQPLIRLNQELLRVSKELQRACMNQDQQVFEALYHEMVQLRAKRWPGNGGGLQTQVRGRSQNTAHAPPHASARHVQQNRVVQFNGPKSTSTTSHHPVHNITDPEAVVEQYIDTIVGIVRQLEAAGYEPTLALVSNREETKELKANCQGMKVSQIVKANPHALVLREEHNPAEGSVKYLVEVAPTYRGCPVELPPMEPKKIRKKPRGLKRQRVEEEEVM